MIRRLSNLFLQDLKVASRNYFHVVVIILAFLMALLVNYVIPEEVKLTPNEIILDRSDNKIIKELLMDEGFGENRFVDNHEELQQRLEADSNTLGVIFEGDIDKGQFTLIGQGSETEESFRLLDAAMNYSLKELRGESDRSGYRIERIRPTRDPISFNKKLIPVFIFTEVILLGFLLIAVMVFQEKEEGSVRAYRVSPSGTLEYNLSKVLVNLILAIMFIVVFIPITAGLRINFLSILLIVILANIVMTLLGLTISVFFKNLEEFIFVAIFIMTVLGMAMMSYLVPSFTPEYIRILPSYPVLFGLKEVLFPAGRGELLSSLKWTLLLELAVMLGISFFTVRRKLMKEG